jgi:hypothetical protein
VIGVVTDPDTGREDLAPARVGEYKTAGQTPFFSRRSPMPSNVICEEFLVEPEGAECPESL